jgi:hypothetical protein
MENEVKKIGSPARHFTDTIKDRGVRGCIRIWQECALLCRKDRLLTNARKISPLSVSLSAMKWGRGLGVRWCSGFRGRSFGHGFYKAECALANQSCVAPMKFQSQVINYQGGRALSRLVVVGGTPGVPQSKVFPSTLFQSFPTASLLQPIRPGGYAATFPPIPPNFSGIRVYRCKSVVQTPQQKITKRTHFSRENRAG